MEEMFEDKESVINNTTGTRTLIRLEEQMRALIADIMEVKVFLKEHLKEQRIENYNVFQEIAQIKVAIGILQTKATAWGALGGAVTALIAIIVAVVAGLIN